METVQVKILFIEDDENLQVLLKKSCEKLGHLPIFFNPESTDRDEMKSKLATRLKSEKPHFAVVDYNLWGSVKGHEFIQTLQENVVPFAAFSDTETHNAELLEKGAFTACDKSRLSGLDAIKKGIEELVNAYHRFKK